jgi:pyrophosphatase PpaX
LRIEAVVFDFDGTIMNTNRVVINSWQHTYTVLRGAPVPEEQIIRTFGEPLEQTMARVFPDVPVAESIEVYRSYHREFFGKDITVFPGMRELLAELKARGLKLSLLTSRVKETTLEGLAKYELAQYFDDLITACDVTIHKPHPDPLLKAIERLGAEKEKCLMVGDTYFDLLCAKNAGVEFVLVGWQQAIPPEELVGERKPEHMIEKAEDLLRLI